MSSVFAYLYRDAGNFKAWNYLLLHGTATPENEATLRGLLIDDEWFVAEQVGLPTLFHELYAYSGGMPTAEDHPWHEFSALRPLSSTDHIDGPPHCSVAELIEAFRRAHAAGWKPV